MAKVFMLLSFQILFLTSILTIITGSFSSGFTLDLIHIDSPNSPYYNGNLTHVEKLQRLGLQSKARAYYLSHAEQNASFPQTIRGQVQVQPMSIHMVQVSVGTFHDRNPHHIQYFLMFDTGSDLTWLQCEDCASSGHHCFPQAEPLFPSSRSFTYRPVPCNDHRYCTSHRCNGKFCTYFIEYQDQAQTTGTLAHDTFTFGSSAGHGREESIELIFGCGFDQKHFDFVTSRENRMAGYLGLGVTRLYYSFIDQTRHLTDGRFSYCLPQTNDNGDVPPSLLRFGSDIPRSRQHLHTTRLLTHHDAHGYFLKLKDMSLAGNRLHIPERFFERGNSGSLGCVIDSGSGCSFIAERPFNMLKTAMIDYFEHKPGFQLVDELYGFNLCFERPDSAGFGQLPRITFHFEGGDIEVRPENLYVLGEHGRFYKFFCLAMYKATNGLTIIGARQQADQRVIYDTQHMQLHFGPEDCAHNA